VDRGERGMKMDKKKFQIFSPHVRSSVTSFLSTTCVVYYKSKARVKESK
jgi:hypothetical protein